MTLFTVSQLIRLSVILCLWTQFKSVSCWDTEELELFDLVEEIDKNFYDLLGVSDSASSAEIRRAYRKLSLQLHPDKNKEEDAEQKFRQLVSVYEVLKDEDRRRRYDEVLVHGLPDWRQPVYYYRRVRKLGLLELTVLLLLILTVGHFLVIWSIYFERRFEREEVFRSTKKKKEKKAKKGKQGPSEDEIEDQLQEELNTIPRPKFTDLIPFKIVRGVIHLVTSIPSWCLAMKDDWERKKREEIERKEEEERLREEEKREAEEAAKRPKRRHRVEIPEYTERSGGQGPVVYMEMQQSSDEGEGTSNTVSMSVRGSSGWTDEDIAMLAKAVAKFPGGTPKRWEKIAEMVGKPVAEVTKKSKTIKSGYAISVDASAQGVTGSLAETVQFKKGEGISNDIISTRSDWPDSNNLDLQGSDGKKRKRPTKVEKSAERTLMITHSPQKQTAAEDIVKRNTANDDSSKDSAPLKVTSNVNSVESSVWNQNQQKIFEWALTHYPKGTDDRWGKIAEHIPGKHKEECMQRFKYLAEMVRKRKQQQQQQQQQQQDQ